MVGLRKTFPLDIASLSVALSAVAVIYGGVRAFYYQVGFLESFSYYSDERPLNAIVNGWIGRDPSETLVGIHAFGDYLLLNVWAQFSDPWGQLDGVNYLPPVILFHKVLGMFPYFTGLTLFLVALAVCLIAPMVIATKGLPLPQRLLLITTLAVLTGPALATLDRANNQGFLPLLLFGFALAVLKERWGWAAVFIAIAATIKIYPIILIVTLIALRKYVWAVVSVGLAAIAVLIALPFTSRASVGGLATIIGDILQYQEKTTEAFLEYNVSFTGGLANLFMMLGADSVAVWVAGNALLIIALYAILVVPLLWSERIPLWLRLILVISLTTALMPISYAYALNWVLAASALTVWVAGRSSMTQCFSNRTSIMLAVSLALVTAVLPVLIPGSAEAGRAAGATSLASLATAVLLPLTALAVRRGSRISAPRHPMTSDA